MLQSYQKEIKRITQKIVKEYQPEKVILFGSWAWGKPGSDSDVDLLVVKRSQKPRLERERELQALLSHREIALDILVYTPEELERGINENHNLFLEDIVRNGRVLYAKSGSEIQIVHQRPLEILQ
ncbi:MAG: nucleotidyltransferase domain-containing protein [Candidatus Portnoybacteria bacterium]|nr:nucleotidyltransferase domain-containing protein [Candidatus Portnoybacteria bacterium]